MQRRRTQRRRDSRSAGSQRHGSLSLWAVFAMLACLCCVSLVLNQAQLIHQRTECRQSAEAAALSAARELLTDDLLIPDREEFEVSADSAKARRAAIAVSALYTTRYNTPALSGENVRIGSMLTNSDTKQTQFLQNTVLPNRVEVLLENAPSAPSGRMMLRYMTGPRHAPVNAFAAASLANRVAAFRSTPHCAIPLVPLALPDGDSSGCWAFDIESYNGNDQWSWSQVSSKPLQAADRLPEMTITIHGDGGAARAGQGIFVAVNEDDGEQAEILRCIETGLRRPSVLVNQSAILAFPMTTASLNVSPAELPRFESALRCIIGQPRIFPLTDVQNEEAPRQIVLTKVVAARVFRVDRREEHVEVTLQPCVLSTPTAVIAPGTSATPQNPYIWNIRLVP